MVAPRSAALTAILIASSAAGAPTLELLGRADVEPPPGAQRFGGLSALADLDGRLFALTDSPSDAAIYEIRWEFGDLEGALRAAAQRISTLAQPPIDAEALALDPALRRVFVAWEQPPSIAAIDDIANPDAPTPLAIPAHVLEHARFNRAFESLALRAEARELWAFTEAALTTDGPEATTAAGTRCRAIVYDARTLQVLREHVYQTLPVPSPLGLDVGFHSLTDACALPDGRILTLERSWAPPLGWGGAIRILTPDNNETDVAGLAQAPDSAVPLTATTIATLDELNLGALGNFEGMTVITDDSGALTVLLISDDNFGRDGQTRTILAALRLTLDDE